MAKKIQETLVKIVAILSDGKYHNGNSIGNTLKMTRSAVWKTVKKLENYHVKIDCVKGKGYALSEPLILLDLIQIKKNLLDTETDIIIFESVDSTNNYLKNFKNTKAPKICLAEQQTQGKGRFNREWFSPFGKNIYVSLLYPFQKDLSELAGLSLVTSLAVLKTLRSYGLDELLFAKWPNDIVCGNKKLSGNLIEVQAETHASCQAVIGVGINVNMLHDTNHNIAQAWTSMSKILNQTIDRNTLCSRLINNLLLYLQLFDTKGFTHFIEEWIRVDCLTHKTIALKNVHEEVRGKVLGVNEQGHLIVESPDGKSLSFSSGETTILKDTFI